LCEEIGTASSGAFYELWRRATYLDIGSILTASRHGAEAELHYTASAHPSRKVGLPYFGIGTGWTNALAAFKIQEYDKSATIEECLLHVACAKRAAEFAYGVDQNTDMVVLTEAGVREVPARTITILTELRNARFHWRLDGDETRAIRESLGEPSG
jgi:hypothetical protein